MRDADAVHLPVGLKRRQAQEGGMLDGSTTTGQEIWEWDGPGAKMLLESGILRKPGAMVTYELTEGKLTLTMTDGKVTGWTASGKGRWPTATGSLAPVRLSSRRDSSVLDQSQSLRVHGIGERALFARNGRPVPSGRRGLRPWTSQLAGKRLAIG